MNEQYSADAPRFLLTQKFRHYESIKEKWRHVELSSFQTVAIVFGIAVGICLVLLRDEILGPKFHSDGLQIQRIALGEIDARGDRSYGLVANIYASLGLASDAMLAAVLSYALFVSFLLLVFQRFRTHRRAWAEVFMLVLSLVLGAVFLGFYSKDVFVIGIIFLFLSQKRALRVDLLFIVLACLYANYFRQYWYLVAITYVVLRLIAWKLRKLSLVVVGVVACIVVISVAIYVVTGETPDFFRTKVNINRFDSTTAASMIRPFIPSSTLAAGVLNNIITLVMLVLPLPLLSLGGSYYLTLFVGISTMWFLFFRAAAATFSKRIGNANPNLASAVRAVCMVLAFLSVQSVFEPDYGSAIRHLTPLLPLMLISMWAARPEVLDSGDRRLRIT